MPNLESSLRSAETHRRRGSAPGASSFGSIVRHLVRLTCLCLVFFSPNSGRAQVLQVWTNSQPFGDASGAAAVGDTLMFVNNNEDAILRLFSRYPSAACPLPIYSLNVQPSLGLTGGDLTADLESCVKLVDGNGTRIYWLGSMGNSTSGNLRPNRSRIFATQVNGDGTGSPPYTLTYVGRYDRLRDDILAWDVNNLHGLGSNYFGLAASAAAGVGPKLVNGFNVEGLTIAPDGTTAYIGCRTPFVNGSGPTTTGSPRTHALIIPLLNLPALVAGNPTPGPGAAQFGAPIVLALGSRGIRSIDVTQTGDYLITAGPADNVSDPPSAPLDFRLFTWNGDAFTAPVERAASFASSYSPEACILPDVPLTHTTIVQFINDDGGSNCWRSMTATIGIPAALVDTPRGNEAPTRVQFSRPPAPSPTRGPIRFAVRLADTRAVEISIHDVAGRTIAKLWHGALGPGEHEFMWSGVPRNGTRPLPGLYWARVRDGERTLAKAFVEAP